MSAPLWTPRLWLTPAAERDVETAHALMLRVLVDKPLPREIVALEMRASTERFAAGAMGLYLVWQRAGGELVGFAGARPFRDGSLTQLVCGFDRRHGGQGFATEAGNAVLARLLADVEIVHASADSEDVAAARLYERLGMTRLELDPDGRVVYAIKR